MLMRLLGIFLLLPALGAAQSGWTRAQGTGYARFTVGTLRSSSFYTPLGNRISSAKYRDVSAAFYGEYGITKDWTAVAFVPYLRNHRIETTSTLTSAGDSTVGLRRSLLRGSTPLALNVDFGLPTGDAQGTVSVLGQPGEEFRLPTGDGEFNTRVSLFGSRMFREGKTVVSAGGGYNIRSRGYTDELSYSVSGSHQLLPTLWISGTLAGLRPAREASLSRSVGFGVGEGVQFVTIGGEVQYRLTKRQSVSGGYYRPLSGKNLLAGGSWVFGFGISF